MAKKKPAKYLELTLLHLATGNKTTTRVCPLPEAGITRYVTLDPAHQIEITWPMIEPESPGGN